MEPRNIRSIVVATDLTTECDRVVRTAASIAALTGAELHLIHVLKITTLPPALSTEDTTPDLEAFEQAQEALEAQVERSTPAGFEPAGMLVVADPSESEAIRRHVEETGADLVVLGPHRGSPTDRPYLGTTADRVIRMTSVPCLIVREQIEFPIRRIGVLTDFSSAARAAFAAALGWIEGFSGGPSARGDDRVQVSVAHLAWAGTTTDTAKVETETIRPQLERFIERVVPADALRNVDVLPRVLWAEDAIDTITRWVRNESLPLVVLGTQGISRLPYLYLGSLASTVARTAPCSVLLVPPDYTPASELEEAARALRVDTVVTGVDFHESSWEAALWAMRYLAPEAAHELVHVIDPPDLPGPLRKLAGNREQLRIATRNAAQRRLEELRDLGVSPHVTTHIREGAPAAEILRLAEESGGDLVVVGEQGPTRGVAALLGSTAERVLFESDIPVLVARKVGDAPPRHLLVAIDPSEISARLLEWARALQSRFDASVTLLNVVDRVLLVDELTGLPTTKTFERLQEDATRAMESWLREQVRTAGLSDGRVTTKVAVGDPAYEIISAAASEKADLLLLGSKGGDVARTPMIGRIVNKVVRSAPCSVLVVSPSNAEER